MKRKTITKAVLTLVVATSLFTVNKALFSSIGSKSKAKVEAKMRASKESKELENHEELLVNSPKIKDNRDYRNFEVSYYCACSKCCDVETGVTASGAKAVEGVTVALPKDVPFGSKVYIENVGEFTCQDRGGYIKNTYGDNGIELTRVDVFVSDHDRALELGRHVEKGYIEIKEES